MPGSPARLPVTVNTSFSHIAIGSSILSPMRNAGLGVDGVSTRSTCSNACSKSRLIKVRTFWAFR
jgi:hypothetical protein